MPQPGAPAVHAAAASPGCWSEARGSSEAPSAAAEVRERVGPRCSAHGDRCVPVRVRARACASVCLRHARLGTAGRAASRFVDTTQSPCRGGP